jgi:hypothetical protein
MDEYGMMENFIETVQNVHIRDCLEIAVQGRGAFRRFKDTANRFDIIEDWYEFKNQAFLAFAKEWCEENGLPYSLEDSK